MRSGSHRPRSPSRIGRGFTIVELLVVVSIIVLLIAMLLPALGKARSLARSQECLSRQRQMVIGFQAYADDYDSKIFPMLHTPGLYWHSMLLPYWADHQAVLICPEATKPSYGRGDNHTAWGPGGGFMNNEMGSYGFNLWFMPKGDYASDTGNMPTNNYFPNVLQSGASNIPVFGDSHWVGAWPDHGDLWPVDFVNGWSAHQKGYFMGRFCLDRHDFAINLGFLDGSAKNVKLYDLWQLKWHTNFVLGNPVGYTPGSSPY